MAASGCALSRLEFVADDTLRWYEPADGVFYGFCGTCGSTLFWRSDGDADWISIAAGTIDKPTGLSTGSAWWTTTAGDYHRLDPEVPSYAIEPD